MKKIINGKLYDTETAKKVGEYSNAGGWRDFNHFEEGLYRKRTGEYFLHGEGGPMTQYARRDGSGWTGSAQIIPMSYDDAKKWAEEHLDADDYMAEFGPVSEDDVKTDNILLKLPAKTGEKLRRIAAERNVSMTALIVDLIDKM